MSSVEHIPCAPCRVKENVLERLDRILYSYGDTYTADALSAIRKEVFDPDRGDRPTIPNRLLIITDDVSNILPQDTLPEALNVRRAGIEVNCTDTPPLSEKPQAIRFRTIFLHFRNDPQYIRLFNNG